MERAVLDDKAKTNRCVQLSLANCLQNVKIYRRQTPDYVLKFLINKGNLTNSQMTETAVLQKWECTDEVERAFNKNKQTSAKHKQK